MVQRRQLRPRRSERSSVPTPLIFFWPDVSTIHIEVEHGETGVRYPSGARAGGSVSGQKHWMQLCWCPQPLFSAPLRRHLVSTTLWCLLDLQPRTPIFLRSSKASRCANPTRSPPQCFARRAQDPLYHSFLKCAHHCSSHYVYSFSVISAANGATVGLPFTFKIPRPREAPPAAGSDDISQGRGPELHTNSNSPYPAHERAAGHPSPAHRSTGARCRGRGAHYAAHCSATARSVRSAPGNDWCQRQDPPRHCSSNRERRFTWRRAA